MYFVCIFTCVCASVCLEKKVKLYIAVQSYNGILLKYTNKCPYIQNTISRHIYAYLTHYQAHYKLNRVYHPTTASYHPPIIRIIPRTYSFTRFAHLLRCCMRFSFVFYSALTVFARMQRRSIKCGAVLWAHEENRSSALTGWGHIASAVC